MEGEETKTSLGQVHSLIQPSSLYPGRQNLGMTIVILSASFCHLLWEKAGQGGKSSEKAGDSEHVGI